jgi:2-keto-4-pentenoate hydratase/2-oxohepta-3-ene-1,7-dioic acid hydratase in catechol pathway
MSDRPFKLATVSSRGSPPFVALVLDERAVGLAAVLPHFREPRRSTAAPLNAAGMLGLLENWDVSFEQLCEVVAFLLAHGLDDERWSLAVGPIQSFAIHAPVPRPPKMLYAAVNYPRAGREPAKPDGIVRRPYMFQKTSSCVAGPYDDIVKPRGFDDLGWEVELALVIGRPGRHIAPERALDHVAGYVVANDVTVFNFRQPNELPIPGPDWFGSKCHDSFAPLGPYLVPRAFVPDCRRLRLTCKVNGELLQDGNTRDMISSPEEQVAHCANQTRLEPGDVISTGTPQGIAPHVGQYLKVGDVVECEVEGLGTQRSRVVDAT